MNSEKTYHCLCGQEFTTPNKFNAHKRNCETHLRNKYGDEYEAFMQSWITRRTRNSGKKQHEEAINKKDVDLQKWIAEQHTCEKCGIIMTEKFGPGRFCSKKCANSRIFNQEAIEKKSKSATKNSLTHQNKLELDYNKHPCRCEICSTPLPYTKRGRKTCSQECMRQVLSNRSKANPHPGGYREGCGNRKKGRYNGIFCDSSWELAFLIYYLDKGKQVIRKIEPYLYVDTSDVVRRYYPDFIIDDTLYEIKGIMNIDVYRKISAVDNYPVKLLTYSDIKPMIEYVQKTYKVKDISELYD